MGGKRRSASDIEGTRINPERLVAARKRTQKLVIIWGFVIAALLLVALIVYGLLPKPSPYVGFAKCLTQSGAIMYGTEWCSHCQAQKRLFGVAFKEIVFVNCDASTTCAERNVTGFPTWILGNAERLEGEQPLLLLSQKTGCILPSNS